MVHRQCFAFEFDRQFTPHSQKDPIYLLLIYLFLAFTLFVLFVFCCFLLVCSQVTIAKIYFNEVEAVEKAVEPCLGYVLEGFHMEYTIFTIVFTIDYFCLKHMLYSRLLNVYLVDLMFTECLP